MKIKKSVLERITREELFRHLHELALAEKEKEPEKKAPPKKKDDKKDPSTVDADAEKKGSSPDKDLPAEPPKGAGPKDAEPPAPKGQGTKPPEQDIDAEPEDDELEKDVTGGDDEGEEEDAEDVTGGGIADELQGKSVQSLTMNPKSKILPGAQEIELTFRESPDPLKILVTKTGQVKFFYRGLHNAL